jgi:succinyl-CoA synthetase beta subunit
VPRHISGTAGIAEIRKNIEEWGGEAIVKPDILSGERGKAGSVVEVKNIQDALKEIKRISSLEINGRMPRIAYLVQKIPADLEIFSAITYNSRFIGPSLTMSLEGGVDVMPIRQAMFSNNLAAPEN